MSTDEQEAALQLLLNNKTIWALREKLISILVKATDQQITMIEAVAIKDIFEVGMKRLGVKPE